jgi:hypothetical protein
MADTRPNYSTPSAVRSVTSYPARRGFKQPIDPSLDRVIGVDDAIDIHCHAHEGQQDALGVAKLASMRIPMKSPPIPKQTGAHSGANRQSEKSERSDAGILFIA